MSYPNTSPTSCHLFRIINTQSRIMHLSLKRSAPCLWILTRSWYLLTSNLCLLVLPPNLAIDAQVLKRDWTLTNYYQRELTSCLSINIMTLLRFVLDNNSSFPRHPFPTHFRLSDGIPCQLHLSQSLHRTCQGEKTLTPNPFKWWFRYADDSYVCVKREHVNEFRSHINSINPQIYNRDRLRRLHCLS